MVASQKPECIIYRADMKRKGSIPNPTRPLPILRASPHCVFHAVLGSEVQLSCSTPRGNSDSLVDSSCRKRVKIRDRDRDRPLTCRTDASPIPLKQRQVTQSNNAKTSEFAFFKKFKEDASLRFNSLPLRQKELQSKKFKSSNCIRERASPVKNICKDLTFHYLIENVTPLNLDSLHSPLGDSSKISEVDVKQAHTSLEDIQSKRGNMENNGTLHGHSDIFSRKRQKLRQFIGNMSFHGTGESYEKGYGFVSMLLSRLMPEGNQNRLDSDFEKLQRLPARSFSRLDYGYYLDDNASPCGLNKSRGRVPSCSDFSTNTDDNKLHHKYRTKESDCEIEEKVNFLGVNDSSFTAAVEKYRSLMSSPFEPLYSLDDQDVPLQLRERGRKTFLLDWNIDNIKNESYYSSQLSELNTFAMPPTSSADDHQTNLQESFGAVALCSSPYPSRNNRNLYSLPCSPCSSLVSYQIHGPCRHNIEKKKDIAAYFNNIHLNFSYVPKCPNQFDNYIDHKGGSNFFCTQSGHWFMNNMFDDGRQHPCMKSLCASSFVFDFGWEYFSDLREHYKAAYHALEFPLDEGRPDVPVDEECSYGKSDDVFLKIGRPLSNLSHSCGKRLCHILPHKLSWDTDENEISVDKTEMDYI